MEAKLRFFSELYNILSVKSCCEPFKRLFNRLAHGNYYYRMLCRATIDRQKIFFENSLQASCSLCVTMTIVVPAHDKVKSRTKTAFLLIIKPLYKTLIKQTVQQLDTTV